MIENMRKYALCLLVLFLPGLSSLQAQELNYGFYFGPSATEVDGDALSGFNKLGLHGALFINRHIDANIYGQAELRYGIRGARKPPTDLDPYSFSSSYHYLQLPLSVFYLNPPTNISFTIGVSPELMVRERYWEGTLPISIDSTDTRTLGMSVFVALGYRPRQNMEIQLRYINSAIPFEPTQEWNHPLYRGYFHNVISLSFMYSFKRRAQASDTEATDMMQE